MKTTTRRNDNIRNNFAIITKKIRKHHYHKFYAVKSCKELHKVAENIEYMLSKQENYVNKQYSYKSEHNITNNVKTSHKQYENAKQNRAYCKRSNHTIEKCWYEPKIRQKNIHNDRLGTL